MKYYSTNHLAPLATLRDAVTKGLAPDKGLYMPQSLPVMSPSFFEHIQDLSLPEIAGKVATALFGEDVPEEELHQIACETLNFEIPVVHVNDNIYSLELFHGPTLAFKDVGARFMARMLAHFVKTSTEGNTINVLAATSGDTGSAVANGFLGVEGIQVYVLYPYGKVSPIQEAQFTTLGQNITAIAIDGTFDDCQALVKKAFTDDALNNRMKLTSANSINLARLLPQTFYYFHAYAQMKRNGLDRNLRICVPSGNFGNIAAGLIAMKMGLPVHRFIAANNRNDVFCRYLSTGEYHPSATIPTIANAMDVGAPSNFARILDLFNGSHDAIQAVVAGMAFDDNQIRETISNVYRSYNYLLDPHGACAYAALHKLLRPGENGLFLETAHPAKFSETSAAFIGRRPQLPQRLQAFMDRKKQSIFMDNDFESFKCFLLNKG